VITAENLFQGHTGAEMKKQSISALTIVKQVMQESSK
jgi:hypothetical protein